jgi:hypothetical protein
MCVVMYVVMAVMMIVAVVMTVAVIMVVIVAIALEEFRFDVEDAVEVEGVAAQNFVERDLGALGFVQPGVGIDGADARLDLC